VQSLSKHATSLQHARLEEKKNILNRKIISWQEIQARYIPAIFTIRRPSSLGQASETVDMSLDLPSSLGKQIPWDKQLGEYEWKLREAQARDALQGLQQNLRLRDFLIKKKKDWSRGVRQNTRSNTVISQAIKKIEFSKTKYRVARNALKGLAPLLEKGEGWILEFRDLRDGDVVGLPATGLGEGWKSLSWIWITQGTYPGPGAQEHQLADGIRFLISKLHVNGANSITSFATSVVSFARPHITLVGGNMHT
jgi:hypothetical protein